MSACILEDVAVRTAEFKESEQQYRRLAISEREIHRLENIFQQLLDFAKPMDLDLDKTDINQVILRCAELLEVKLTQQNTCCTIQTDDTLPRIMADRSKLEQLVIKRLDFKLFSASLVIHINYDKMCIEANN